MKRYVLLLIIPLVLFLGAQLATAQAQQKTTISKQSTSWNNFRTETLNGTISIVAPGSNKVFVTGPKGASYKFMVTNMTKIEVGGKVSSINALSNQTDKQVTVTFVARARGDIAHNIKVSS